MTDDFGHEHTYLLPQTMCMACTAKKKTLCVLFQVIEGVLSRQAGFYFFGLMLLINFTISSNGHADTPPGVAGVPGLLHPSDFSKLASVAVAHCERLRGLVSEPGMNSQKIDSRVR